MMTSGEVEKLMKAVASYGDGFMRGMGYLMGRGIAVISEGPAAVVMGGRG